MSVGVRRAVCGESWCFEALTSLAEGLAPSHYCVTPLPRAPVDIDRGAGNVPGALRGEEAHEIGNIFRLAQALQWNRLTLLGIELIQRHVGEVRLPASGPLGALQTPEADGVDQDVVGGIRWPALW